MAVAMRGNQNESEMQATRQSTGLKAFMFFTHGKQNKNRVDSQQSFVQFSPKIM